MSDTVSAKFPCDDRAPATARAWGLSVASARLSAISDELADTLELLISELVTNARRAQCRTVKRR